MLILLILSYYWLVARRERWIGKFGSASLLLVVSAVLAALPLAIYFVRSPGSLFERTSDVSVLNAPRGFFTALFFNATRTAMMFHFVGDLNWRHNYSGRPELSNLVGVLLLVGIVAGINPVRRVLEALRRSWSAEVMSFDNPLVSEGFAFTFVFVWFVIAMLPAVLSHGGLPHSLRAILAAPMAYTLAACGAERLYRYLEPRYSTRHLIPAVGIFCVLLIGESCYLYFKVWGDNPATRDAFAADSVEIARQISALPIQTSKYVVVPQDGGSLVDGVSVAAQTVMFITDTFERERQWTRNVHYVVEGHEKDIPKDALVFQLKAHD